MIKSAISLLLVLAFALISVAQILHSHALENDTETIQKESVSLSEKCGICDYIIHKQGKEVVLTAPYAFAVPLPEAVVITSGVFAGIYKFTLQGFTNKGPPAILA